MYILHKLARINKTDKEFLESLPDNQPSTVLTKKQKDCIDTLYYKYIGKKFDNIDWSENLFELEKQNTWCDGVRTKQHEAKRFCLNWLLQCPVKMTNKKASSCFFDALTGRKAYAKLLSYVYSEER